MLDSISKKHVGGSFSSDARERSKFGSFNSIHYDSRQHEKAGLKKGWSAVDGAYRSSAYAYVCERWAVGRLSCYKNVPVVRIIRRVM